MEFRDAYTALVHNNKNISDITKFYYLKSSLQDHASEVIQSIEVTSANYPIAWQLVQERFENKRLIVFNHVKAIFEFPQVQKETFSDLRKLYDTITRNLRSLKSLEEPVDSWDTLIIYVIVSKFDHVTRREWEAYPLSGNMPTMEEINKFLKQRCDLLEKLDNNLRDSKTNKKPQSKFSYSGYVSVDNKMKCYFCKEGHAIYRCAKFLDLKVDQRIKNIKQLNLCQNCLRPNTNNHSIDKCEYSNCKLCNRSHNTLLHLDYSQNKKEGKHNSDKGNIATDVEENPQRERSEVQITSSNVANSKVNSQVLLSTAIVLVKDNCGNYQRVRCLLDNGSQSNFITEELCNKLHLSRQKVKYCVTGVGQALAGISQQTNVGLKSCSSSFSAKISCLILPKITERLPSMPFNETMLKIPSNVQLADPTFYKQDNIDLLIGSDLFWDLICVGQIKLERANPYFRKHCWDGLCLEI